MLASDNVKYDSKTISLVLFADGVVYNKPGANTMWTLLSCIAELSPVTRGSFENIIFHSIWSGPEPDFNFWLEKYNEKINHLITKGFE